MLLTQKLTPKYTYDSDTYSGALKDNVYFSIYAIMARMIHKLNVGK